MPESQTVSATAHAPSCTRPEYSQCFYGHTSGPNSNILPAVAWELSLDLLFLLLELSRLQQRSASVNKVRVSVTLQPDTLGRLVCPGHARSRGCNQNRFPPLPRVQDPRGPGSQEQHPVPCRGRLSYPCPGPPYPLPPPPHLPPSSAPPRCPK